jgi:Zn-dependent protease
MDPKPLVEGLILYLTLLILLTFHEFGHAWTAWKCGDDTAKSQGRVSLNPIVHIDLIGSVLLPLIMIFASPAIGGFLVGWAKPVPVDPSKLRNRKVDDILVTLAGPGMNLILAVALLGLARIGAVSGLAGMEEVCKDGAHLSLLLCFFNLLPIPPLDGSQVARVLIGMSYETYYQIARYGIFILIVALQIPFVTQALSVVTLTSYAVISGWMGLAV